ncbi:MAG TPA: glycosyltransferase, partial [Roseiarcus sp.]|nr:glycosyltransferase [Roseiarcus sp.]
AEEGGLTRLAVSVIMPHYNDLENLQRCLDGLDRQAFPRDRYEIVVADNNSRCGLAAVAEVCGARARAVGAPIQGAGEARNAAVAASRGDALAFIDSDCRPDPHWLERGLAALANADIAGGRIVVAVDDRDHPTAVEAFELAFAFNTRRYVLNHHYCVTANMFTRRAVFDAVGPFRTRVSEDLDWGLRATRLGFRMAYAPEAVVEHPARRTWDELVRKWRRLSAEMFDLAAEEPRGRLRWFVRTWALLASPATGVVEVLANRNLRSTRERLDAYAILLRLRAWRFVENNRLMLKG